MANCKGTDVGNGGVRDIGCLSELEEGFKICVLFLVFSVSVSVFSRLYHCQLCAFGSKYRMWLCHYYVVLKES